MSTYISHITIADENLFILAKSNIGNNIIMAGQGVQDATGGGGKRMVQHIHQWYNGDAVARHLAMLGGVLSRDWGTGTIAEMRFTSS